MSLEEQQYIENIDYSKCPESVRDTLKLYITYGFDTGDFLYYVLSNNLTRAFYNADKINKPIIEDILIWLYNHAPSSSWGSPEKVAEWIDSRKTTSHSTKKNMDTVAMADNDADDDCDCHCCAERYAEENV